MTIWICKTGTYEFCAPIYNISIYDVMYIMDSYLELTGIWIR